MSSLIKFTNYFNEPSSKYDIVSCCIFLLEQNYKDIYIYYNGLVSIIKNFRRLLPNYYLRIYFDDSLLYTGYKSNELNKINNDYWIPFIKKIKQMHFIQLIKVDCEKVKKNKYSHHGLFMSMSRFCPLFYNNNLINKILFIDIDSGVYDIKFITSHLLPYYKKYNPTIIYNSRLCNLTRKRHLSYPFGMAAHSWISKGVFNKSIFEDFLINIYNRKLDNDLLDKLEYKTQPTTSGDLFIYGIDEYFLNHIFLKYCFNKSIYTISSVTNIHVINLLYTYRYKLYELQNEDLKLLKDLLQKLLGIYYNKSNTVKENIELFNTLIFVNKRTKTVLYLLKNIRKYIPLLKQDDFPKLFINKRYVNMIQNNNFIKYHNRLLIIKSKKNIKLKNI